MTPSTLRIGYRYRPGRLADAYDAVVIGSGMGGLTTAAMLSDLGWKVCVLEQHYTAGGYTHSYERNGYEWDVGVHYIGDVGAKTRTRKMFDYLSDIMQFPDEEQAIDAYLTLLKSAGNAMSSFGMARVLGSWQQTLMSPYLKWKTPDILFRNTYDVLAELTDNQDLIAVWCGQWGDMGLPPKQSTFLVHAMIARHYMYGGYYPVTYARVENIVVDNGRVKGVKMQDGHLIECPCVISSAGVSNTFEELLPTDVAANAGYERKLKSVAPSSAHLGVYIGLKNTAKELGLPKTNFWIYPDSDYDGAVERFNENKTEPFPVVYISFPSAKDPNYLERHPGTATIEIVAPAPYEWFEKWHDKTWGKRGDDYDAFKQELGERLMTYLYDKLPELRGKVDYYEVSTPLSTNWFGGYQRGELYGLSHTPERLQQKWLRPKTTIPGLWLTGQDILTCGVTGAMMAGVLTTTAIVGVRKIAPLMKRIYS